MSTSVDIEVKDFGYFDSDVTGFDDATGLPIFDRAQNSEFLANMLAAIIGNGVYPNPSTNLQVVERDDGVFGVQVLPGRVWIGGRFAYPKEAILLESEPASTTADRIDAVVVERNAPDRKFSIKCVSGTPAATPVAPAPERSTDIHQLVLAHVRVRKNATSINAVDIDSTVRMDNELCGYVTGVIEQIDGETLFAQIEAIIAGEVEHLNEQNEYIQELIKDIQTQDLIGVNTAYPEHLNTNDKTAFGGINEVNGIAIANTDAIALINEFLTVEARTTPSSKIYFSSGNFAFRKRAGVVTMNFVLNTKNIAIPSNAVLGSVPVAFRPSGSAAYCHARTTAVTGEANGALIFIYQNGAIQYIQGPTAAYPSGAQVEGQAVWIAND